MSNDTLKIVLGTTSGLLVGGLAGYLVTKKLLKTQFEELLDQEVAEVKEYYKNLNEEKKEEVIPEESVVEVSEEVEILKNAKSIMKTHGYSVEYEEDREVEVDSETHVKDDGSTYTVQSAGYVESNKVIPGLTNGDVIDYTSPEFKEMVANRDADYPYVITVDEYMDDCPEFEKQCVSYFEEDDILSDERDIIIDDVESTIGVENLAYFGKYSKDNDIVYIRNERISVDFEVAFHPESYVKLITGFKKRKLMETEDD